MARRILIVEDDRAIAAAVADRLRAEGFQVDVATDGHAALDACATTEPDLVVLDVMLPGLDGIEICRLIQRDRHVPVLMLSARDTEADKLVGLAVGADDYLTKPFSPRELVARVRAILRRFDAASALATNGTPSTLQIGDLIIDHERRRVQVGGDEVHLTATEFDLLAFLANPIGAVRTRDQLLAAVWGYRDGSGARTVDSHVRSLRKKVGFATIRTVHGVGYAFAEDQPGR